MFEKGHQHSENWYKKLIGNTWGFKKGHTYSHWTGKKLPEETRRKMSKSHKGFKGLVHTEETKAKIREARKKQVGEKCPAWKGGITPVNTKIRNSIQYRLWRESVFARDNWVCQKCDKRGGDLEAHHIKSFADFPELRFAIDNGITYCVGCHKAVDSYRR